jgi:ABC-type Na+ efflux pump permease subunit
MRNRIQKFLDFFRDSGQVTKKDLKDFYRDRARIISFIIMPMFMMLLTGFIFPSQSSLKEVPIGIVNFDNGTVSAQVVDVLTSLKVQGSTKKVMLLKPVAGESKIKELIQKQALS